MAYDDAAERGFIQLVCGNGQCWVWKVQLWARDFHAVLPAAVEGAGAIRCPNCSTPLSVLFVETVTDFAEGWKAKARAFAHEWNIPESEALRFAARIVL